MSEINTKIFKPQKWVLDVLNSPKGEVVIFDFDGGREAIKISSKVPDIIYEKIHICIFLEILGEDVSFTCQNMENSVEHLPNLFIISELFYILTEDTDGISKGVYVDSEVYEMIESFKLTSFFTILQTTQDFSISKKTIEGEVHPIEEKYIPGGGSGSNFEIDLRITDTGSGYDLTLNTPIDKIQEAVNNGSSIRVKAVRIPYNARSTETRESQQDPIDYFYPTRIHINNYGFFTIECRDTMVDSGVTVSDTLKIGSCNDDGGTYFVEYEDYNGTTGTSSDCSVS